MLSITHPSAFPPAPAGFNMAAHVLAHADRLADKPALQIVGDMVETYRYADIATAVRGTAAGLLGMGLVPGDHLLLQLGNTAEFPITYLGAIAAGIIPVPVSSQLTAPEVAAIVATIQPALTIRAPGMAAATGRTEDASILHDFRALPPAPFAMGDPDRPAYIIYTSGTSGKPRPVVHAHRAIWARQMMWDGWYGLREDDRLMHAGAFNWTYTLGTGLMDPWSVGATALIPADGVSADQLPALLAAHKATIFAAAPGVYRRVLRAGLPPLPHLRHGLSAGEKLAEDYRSDWETQTGTPIFEAFGMSECSTFISGSPARPAPVGSSGYAQPGRKVALIGPDGPVERGTPGTIAIHRSDPGLMLGYLGAPDETAARFQGDWFLTGDIGIMADDGAITYAGRADDMMNAGGYRVSPVEVEDALTAHPHITEAAACAVQIRTGTSVIAAFYVATDVIDEQELRNFMAARLAGYKCPRIYVAHDALPRGANNKLLRRVLRQEWETANGQA
ncbi:class I adenylate-forming enzyme family protein [Yoonia sp.]|uniref:class I adenylate-forming enzyme family protein n=1 Tax=Yoonia sp. TaxID=2212373 RepID=UPI0019DF84C2|nr:class I adenylate-forming enzyme family protein [Yoonia sp.]MBE0413410.1 acyl--CoA ligase [Yoonia sp.]